MSFSIHSLVVQKVFRRLKASYTPRGRTREKTYALLHEVQPDDCLNRTYTAEDDAATSVYLCIALDLLLLLNVSSMPAFDMPEGRLVQLEAVLIYI